MHRMQQRADYHLCVFMTHSQLLWESVPTICPHPLLPCSLSLSLWLFRKILPFSPPKTLIPARKSILSSLLCFFHPSSISFPPTLLYPSSLLKVGSILSALSALFDCICCFLSPPSLSFLSPPHPLTPAVSARPLALSSLTLLFLFYPFHKFSEARRMSAGLPSLSSPLLQLLLFVPCLSFFYL